MSLPPSQHYDAVVIGAGHNGLILATYLQRAGYRTLLVERDASIGGMTCTHEPMSAGFRHSPHANFLAYQAVTPIMQDLQLRARGLATFEPDIQHGIAFADARPPVLVHRVGHEEGSLRSFARHSARDAATYVDLRKRAATLTPAIRDVLFHPLSSAGIGAHRAAMAQAFGELAEDARLGTRSAAQFIDERFESPEIRTLLYLLAMEFGASLTQAGDDLAFLGFVLWMIGSRQVPIGGMQSFADALHRAALAEGVQITTFAEVGSIRIEAGRVKGIVIAGRFIEAPIVASSIGVERTLLDLPSGGGLGASDRQALAAYRRGSGSTIASQAFALTEAPRYRSARWDADLDRCVQTFIGFDSPESVLLHERELAMGLLPSPRASMRVPSLFDPSLAPAGFHVAGADSHFPDEKALSEEDWQGIAESYNEALLDVWSSAAPNMTRDTVIASHFAIPRSGDRRVLLREGGQYSTSIAGLYLCGTSTYPGGGVHGACAINAFQEITGVQFQ
ncbi:phytoene desaturase family protein [Hydrocarboniphaga effusa]|uniref:phytoene desaturase family protein n=1 Tax=Hydrocarboniphaga effusa TaxID=243629 RepID=UPI003BAC588F